MRSHANCRECSPHRMPADAAEARYELGVCWLLDLDYTEARQKLTDSWNCTRLSPHVQRAVSPGRGPDRHPGIRARDRPVSRLPG